PAHDAGAPRRRRTGVRIWGAVEGGHLLGRADGPSEEAGLGRHQHEERLAPDLPVRVDRAVLSGRRYGRNSLSTAWYSCGSRRRRRASATRRSTVLSGSEKLVGTE